MSEILNSELEKIHSRYQFRFAGQPRITRNLAELEAIVADASDVLRRASRLSRANGGETMTLAQERVDLYTNERENVKEAQSGGPNPLHASLLATRANAVFANYRRHFAGKDRGTRDLGLLTEMLSDLSEIKSKMTDLLVEFDTEGLRADLNTVEQNMDLYEREFTEIQNTRKMGSASEQVSRLATSANNQFALYSAHFAGKSRVSRRPNLIERIIGELKEIHIAMSEIDMTQTGFNALTNVVSVGNDSTPNSDADRNNANMDIVRSQIEAYENELSGIRAAKESTNVDTLIPELAKAANESFKAFDTNFAGQNRSTRDLALLNTIIDGLGEVERQMALLDRAYKDKTNADNLNIVRDTVVRFNREYTQIQEAQSGTTPQAGTKPQV